MTSRKALVSFSTITVILFRCRTSSAVISYQILRTYFNISILISSASVRPKTIKLKTPEAEISCLKLRIPDLSLTFKENSQRPQNNWLIHFITKPKPVYRLVSLKTSRKNFFTSKHSKTISSISKHPREDLIYLKTFRDNFQNPSLYNPERSRRSITNPSKESPGRTSSASESSRRSLTAPEHPWRVSPVSGAHRSPIYFRTSCGN